MTIFFKSCLELLFLKKAQKQVYVYKVLQAHVCCDQMSAMVFLNTCGASAFHLSVFHLLTLELDK